MYPPPPARSLLKMCLLGAVVGIAMWLGQLAKRHQLPGQTPPAEPNIHGR